jgi:hypothetical protein
MTAVPVKRIGVAVHLNKKAAVCECPVNCPPSQSRPGTHAAGLFFVRKTYESGLTF